MKKILSFLILSVVVCTSSFGQLRYSVTGTYNKLSAQGMAIWESTAYLFNNTGVYRVLNLETGTIVAVSQLGSHAPTTHVNSACFGREIPEGGQIPAIYIGEWTDEGRVFVENISPEGSQLLQTIRVVENGEVFRNLAWAVDCEEGCLYGITRYDFQSCDNVITKYRLPALNEGSEVTLTEKDVLDRFEVEFYNALQGLKVKDGLLYITTGLDEPVSDRRDAGRAIKVVDLKTKELVKDVDLTFVSTNEPEDMDFYGDTPLLYCGQTGGIYEFEL